VLKVTKVLTIFYLQRCKTLIRIDSTSSLSSLGAHGKNDSNKNQETKIRKDIYIYIYIYIYHGNWTLENFRFVETCAITLKKKHFYTKHQEPKSIQNGAFLLAKSSKLGPFDFAF
jgi:hypothetical protein